MNFLKFSTSTPSEPSASHIVDGYVDAWKKTIEVQQHFNDLSWRIRALWLTALTFALGATFIAFKDGRSVELLGVGQKSPAVVVPILGLLLWLAFWFVDRQWYHRLLVGAVKEGLNLEKKLRDLGVDVALTKTIGDESPWNTWLGKMHSAHKLNFFYVLGGLPLVVSLLILMLQP
ncbi:hypothetical protein [Paenarthrobacter sp. A20]|uniref:hypothetical protein n=1 Tax=Paenarthrobacter sp. A20 TaxID=2817891 RepID=UPI0020A1048E|nr:hypothetical protein [Paenarthrobacter sp. A20]MCP1415497.1 hypothetical protein [Paenarthrobacter sp. A20]